MRALRRSLWPASRSPSPRAMPECRTTSHTAAQLRVSHEWPPRLLSRIGLLARAPMARSIPRPTAGCSGASTTLVPFPHIPPVAVLFAEVAYLRASGPKDPQAQEREHGHEGEVVRVRGLVAGGFAAAGRTCASSSVSAGPARAQGS